MAKNLGSGCTGVIISLFSPDNIATAASKKRWKSFRTTHLCTMDPNFALLDERDGEKRIKWIKNMEDGIFVLMLGMIRFMPQKWWEKRSSP